MPAALRVAAGRLVAPAPADSEIVWAIGTIASGRMPDAAMAHGGTCRFSENRD